MHLCPENIEPCIKIKTITHSPGASADTCLITLENHFFVPADAAPSVTFQASIFFDMGDTTASPHAGGQALRDKLIWLIENRESIASDEAKRAHAQQIQLEKGLSWLFSAHAPVQNRSRKRFRQSHNVQVNAQTLQLKSVLKAKNEHIVSKSGANCDFSHNKKENEQMFSFALPTVVKDSPKSVIVQEQTVLMMLHGGKTTLHCLPSSMNYLSVLLLQDTSWMTTWWIFVCHGELHFLKRQVCLCHSLCWTDTHSQKLLTGCALASMMFWPLDQTSLTIFWECRPSRGRAKWSAVTQIFFPQCAHHPVSVQQPEINVHCPGSEAHQIACKETLQQIKSLYPLHSLHSESTRVQTHARNQACRRMRVWLNAMWCNVHDIESMPFTHRSLPMTQPCGQFNENTCSQLRFCACVDKKCTDHRPVHNPSEKEMPTFDSWSAHATCRPWMAVFLTLIPLTKMVTKVRWWALCRLASTQRHSMIFDWTFSSSSVRWHANFRQSERACICKKRNVIALHKATATPMSLPSAISNGMKKVLMLHAHSHVVTHPHLAIQTAHFMLNVMMMMTKWMPAKTCATTQTMLMTARATIETTAARKKCTLISGRTSWSASRMGMTVIFRTRTLYSNSCSQVGKIVFCPIVDPFLSHWGGVMLVAHWSQWSPIFFPRSWRTSHWLKFWWNFSLLPIFDQHHIF